MQNIKKENFHLIRRLGLISFTSTGVENVITVSVYQPNLTPRYSDFLHHFHFLPGKSFPLHTSRIINIQIFLKATIIQYLNCGYNPPRLNRFCCNFFFFDIFAAELPRGGVDSSATLEQGLASQCITGQPGDTRQPPTIAPGQAHLQ